MSYTVLIAVADSGLRNALKTELTAFSDIRPVFPDEPLAQKAQVAVCWRPEASLVEDFPNLKLLQSAAAGIDHFGQSILSSGLPICRIVDKEQQKGMLEYTCWAVLNHHRDFDRIRHNQSEKIWYEFPQRPADDIRVGILGLGAIGSFVAEGLCRLGYRVSGWCRSPKKLSSVEVYCGESSLPAFLNQSEILVNILPLNRSTHGILNGSLFSQLPEGATVINIGRGEHLVEDELLQALNSSHLRHAVLDVFNQEPLPAEHPFWTHPRITVTPHIASSASVSSIADQAVENTRRLNRGKPLLNTVIDPDRLS